MSSYQIVERKVTKRPTAIFYEDGSSVHEHLDFNLPEYEAQVWHWWWPWWTSIGRSKKLEVAKWTCVYHHGLPHLVLIKLPHGPEA